VKYLCKQTCWIAERSLYCQRGSYYEFSEDPGYHFEKVGDAKEKRVSRKPHPITSPNPQEGTPMPEYVEEEVETPEEPPAEETEEPDPEE